jgi:CRISPR-associated endoribonuclease Cas2
MSFRFMRLLVFFDLPTNTTEDKRFYRNFRKFLIKNGFIMEQESVYSKLALNGTSINNIKSRVKKAAPPAGTVEMLCVTEKQFANMEMVVGSVSTNIVNSPDRMLVL